MTKNWDVQGQGESAGASPLLNRRAVIQRAAVLGLAPGLAAAGPWVSAPAKAAAAFDPRKYAGTTISILMIGGEGEDKALADLVPQLETETGIKLEIQAPAMGPLIEKTLQNLKADRSSFEVMVHLGFLVTQQVGYLERLNPYLDDPTQTPSDWDFADFIPATVENVGAYDLKTHTKGGPDIYGIPGMESTSCLYFYRKDLFEKAGLKPAKTWEEFHAAAKALNSPDVAGCSFIGANDFSLAMVDWYTRFITIGGKLMSGSPQSKDFMPHVDSKEGIAALQMLIDSLPYAPKNVTQYGFAENVDGFSTGKIAQMIFWSTIAGAVFDKDKSLVFDKVGTAPVPAAPGEKARAVLGGWAVSIPKNADPAKKAAAWRVASWITSKNTNRFEAEQYQLTPSRASTYADKDLVARFPFMPDAYRALVNGDLIPTGSINEFMQLNDLANVEFNKALIGGQDAASACGAVQKQWEAVLRKSGYLA